jgi:hypothetical protein
MAYGHDLSILGNECRNVWIMFSCLFRVLDEEGRGISEMINDTQQTTTKREHDLKVWPEFWDMLASGDKPFELRKDDRGFRAGDTLLLREWSKRDGYSGRQLSKIVTCIVAGLPWLREGMVCMGLQDVE